MGSIIEKLGLYDIFARGMTGTIVILAAKFLGIADWFGISEKGTSIPIWSILVAGYFCGVVLEELSYILEKRFSFRGAIEQKVIQKDEYREIDYKKCKDKLLADDKVIFLDEPMAHVVMSSSLGIAFFGFFIFEAANTLYMLEARIGVFNAESDKLCITFVKTVILLGLIYVFYYRANHYSERRVEQIFDYCIARYGTDSLKKEEKQNEEQ